MFDGIGARGSLNGNNVTSWVDFLRIGLFGWVGVGGLLAAWGARWRWRRQRQREGGERERDAETLAQVIRFNGTEFIWRG